MEDQEIAAELRRSAEELFAREGNDFASVAFPRALRTRLRRDRALVGARILALLVMAGLVLTLVRYDRPNQTLATGPLPFESLVGLAPGCLPLPPTSVSPLDVSLTMRKSRYSTGNPITFDVSARNRTASIVRNDRGWLEYQVWVQKDDRVIWVSSYEGPTTSLPDIRVHEVWRAGENRSRSEVWDQTDCLGQHVTPGSYTVQVLWGTLLGSTNVGKWSPAYKLSIE